ncbi:MAG: diacylglycerol kinase family lipid kinase [Thermodesulfobacteriota bacterium]|nr:diacylglycerol kinase family lipid kinase [Thermodesulfobacteriota bacterium]
MRMLVIVNPAAGGGKTLRLFPKIKRWLSESPHEFFFTIPKSPDEMRSEIVNASARGIDAILILGGDGTVHDILPAIATTNLPFGFLPCGRGNDLVRNAGLLSNLKKSCHLPSDPSFSKFDLPTVNEAPFIGIAYLGFDAEVNKLANDGKGYFGGKLGYTICVLKTLKKFRPFEIEMTIDDHYLRERVMMVSVANGPYYGGGMKIAPQAAMNDGILDICIVKEISKWELLRQFPKVFNGTHISHPKIMMKSGRRIKIISDESREIFADGEYVGSLPAECTIGDQTVRILSPPISPISSIK